MSGPEPENLNDAEGWDWRVGDRVEVFPLLGQSGYLVVPVSHRDD